ncbi:MAG: VOC family protein [Rhodobacteraceae bacterium]|nr:VOC family protein [Paracoccaceae bacterium]
MTDEKGFRPRALGEIAIRCTNMAAMIDFYQNTIGLERLADRNNRAITFFKIADGYAGHTSVLALFHDPNTPVTGASSSLHHIALSLPYHEQDAVIRWYKKINQPYTVEHFAWIGWRGIFTKDPEGNTVELVAYDPSVTGP